MRLFWRCTKTRTKYFSVPQPICFISLLGSYLVYLLLLTWGNFIFSVEIKDGIDNSFIKGWYTRLGVGKLGWFFSVTHPRLLTNVYIFSIDYRCRVAPLCTCTMWSDITKLITFFKNNRDLSKSNSARFIKIYTIQPRPIPKFQKKVIKHLRSNH